MKKILVFFSLLLFVFCTNNNKEVGVNFVKLSFDETLAKAAKENKPILVDVFSHG